MSWLSNLLGRWFPPRPNTSTPPSGPVIGDLLAAHNTLRLSRGLIPLVLSSELIRCAQAHADWMAAHNLLNHNEGWADPGQRLTNAGYIWTGEAENIAMGQKDVAEVMLSWQTSPGHMADILGPYREVGFGRAVARDGMIYWCTDFGSR